MLSPSRLVPTKPNSRKVSGTAAGSAATSFRQSASRGGTASQQLAANQQLPRQTQSAGSTSPSQHTQTARQHQAMKQSRAAAIKMEAAGTQQLRQLVELLHDPATHTHYQQQVAGVMECLSCFPDGFSPTIAQEGVGQLVAGLTQVVATLAPGSEAVVPALIATITKCSMPIVCVTLEDQHQAEAGIRAICLALCSALTAPIASVRIATAVALHKIFTNIRQLAGDDSMSEAERRDLGEVAVWKANARRSVTLEVLQSLTVCWSDTISEEYIRLKNLSEQITAAEVANDCENQESDDEGASKVNQSRASGRPPNSRNQHRSSTAATNIVSGTGGDQIDSRPSTGERDHGGSVFIRPTLAQLSVRELDQNAKRVANARDSSVDLTEMVAILKAVREISVFAPQATELVMECDACNLLVRTMSVCERGDRRIAVAVEILWNLLELCPEAASHCCDQETIDALHQTFLECLSIGYKLKERELRNDMIVVVTAISEAPNATTFLGPFAEILLELSCGNEKHNGRSESPYINPRHHYTLSNEDQQAKSLAWGFLARLCRESAADADTTSEQSKAATAILEWGFVDVLISYLDVHCEQPAVVRWSTPQLLDLQEQALLILAQVAEIGWQHFLRCGAPTVLHSYIAECPDVQLRNLALTLLARLAVTDAKVAVAESGAVPVAVQLLTESDDDVLSIECLNLLADIVDREPHQQLLFLSCGGVQAVLPRIVFSPTYHTTRREEVVLSAFDCCWSCIFGYAECEAAFIRAGGVSACLLALENISFEGAPFILSALADLFSNRTAIPEVRSWMSPKTGRSAVQLFIELWRKSSGDASDHMVAATHKDPNRSGLMSSATTRPTAATGLRGGVAPRLHRQGQGEVSEEAAAMTHAQDTHIKIYACMCRVGFADHRELGPGERATLSHMEVFEHLCNDLAWAAVNRSLQEENITPIASDRAKLDGVLAEGAARKKALDTIQELYRKEEQQRIEDRENAFYKTIIKKTDEELPPGVVTCGMTITQAKLCKSQMLKESVQQAQAHQHAKAVEKARSIATPSDQPSTSNSRGPTAQGNARQGASSLHTSTAEFAHASDRGGGEGQKAMTEEEFAILKLMNTVRTDPASFIPYLQQRAAELSAAVPAGNDGTTNNGATEGVSAIMEAISVLENARRIVTFLDVPMGMLFATRDHATDIKRRMDVSPNSFDGTSPLQRLMRYGTVPQKSVLLQVVGKKSPEEILFQLLVDDGIPSRIDRRNILDPEMRCASVSLAPHPFHDSVAIIAMAHEYLDKPREQQHDVNRKVHAKMKGSV